MTLPPLITTKKCVAHLLQLLGAVVQVQHVPCAHLLLPLTDLVRALHQVAIRLPRGHARLQRGGTAGHFHQIGILYYHYWAQGRAAD